MQYYITYLVTLQMLKNFSPDNHGVLPPYAGFSVF